MEIENQMMKHLSASYGLPQINRIALNPPYLITRIVIDIFLQKFKNKIPLPQYISLPALAQI